MTGRMKEGRKTRTENKEGNTDGRKEKHWEWKESWRSEMIRNGRGGEDQ